jgi:orotidine-5'-phosphate decarboxylase
MLPHEVFRGVREGPAGLARALERFCTGIVEAVAEHAVAIKPQLAFFEQAGHHGLAAVERVAERARALGLLVIADGKRGDIGSTAEAYASAYLAPRGQSPPLADALTVNPYLGADSLQPFADACRASGGLMFVLVRTSNPGGADLQELELADGSRVWERVARIVASLAPVAGAVVGATQPGAVGRARELMPDATFLLPGIGAQGGEIAALGPAFAPGPAGGLVSASRSILYASRADGRWQAAAATEAGRLREAAWAVVERA